MLVKWNYSISSWKSPYCCVNRLCKNKIKIKKGVIIVLWKIEWIKCQIKWKSGIFCSVEWMRVGPENRLLWIITDIDCPNCRQLNSCGCTLEWILCSKNGWRSTHFDGAYVADEIIQGVSQSGSSSVILYWSNSYIHPTRRRPVCFKARWFHNIIQTAMPPIVSETRCQFI